MRRAPLRSILEGVCLVWAVLFSIELEVIHVSDTP